MTASHRENEHYDKPRPAINWKEAIKWTILGRPDNLITWHEWDLMGKPRDKAELEKLKTGKSI